MDSPLDHVAHFLSDVSGGIPLSRLAIALAVFLTFFFLRRVLAKAVLGFAGKIALRTRTEVDDAIVRDLEHPVRFAWVVLGLHVAARIVPLHPEAALFMNTVVQSLVTVVVFWSMLQLTDALSLAFKKLFGLFGADLGVDLHQFFLRALKVIIVFLGVMAVLQQWGVNVAAFLGGLGLAGMAVALAAKETVQNVFGGLTIFADRTYQRGDWVETPFVEGTVEVIGLRSTKIRAFNKTLITVPNARMSEAAVINWSRMPVRRVKMDIGLEYRTTRAQATRIIERLRGYLRDHPDIDNQTTQMVHLVSFGDSALIINLYYFTTTTIWEQWRDIINRNILDFMSIVEEEGAAFAFPSRTLYVEGAGDHPVPFLTPPQSKQTIEETADSAVRATSAS